MTTFSSSFFSLTPLTIQRMKLIQLVHNIWKIIYFFLPCLSLLLQQAYEWGVEAMKLASKLKLDLQPCPPSVASHLLHQVDQFLKASESLAHPAALQDLTALARKLDNPKLLDQCKVKQQYFSADVGFRYCVIHFYVNAP